MADNKPDARQARKRYVAPDKVRTLVVDGHTAREAYVMATLKALARHGTLRMQGVARAVFATRDAVAGHAAAKRTLKACVEQRLVEARRKPGTQQVYYALTRQGAQSLDASGMQLLPASSTVKLLSGSMLKAEHREWAAAIVEAAEAREGLKSYGELEIQRMPGTVSRTLVDERFKGQHMPDALTFHAEERLVVWHEVELSRRNHWTEAIRAREQRRENTRAKARRTEPRTMRSGRSQFVHLLQTLRAARVLEHRGVMHQVVLVAHCGTDLIRSELARLVEGAFVRDTFDAFPAALDVMDPGRHYRVNWNASDRFGFFEIWLQALPASDSAEMSVYSADLLWPDAPHAVREHPISERFIAS